MEIKHVLQKDRYGCAPACLAMVLGVEYEQATGLVPMGSIDQGTDALAIQRALIKRKHRVVYRHRLARPFAPVHILCIAARGKVLMSAADSIDMRHIVVMREDGTVLDPSGRVYPFTEIDSYVYWTLGVYPPHPKAKEDAKAA